MSRAFWRGDVKREPLQRVYGVTFPDSKLLKDYQHRMEEVGAGEGRAGGAAGGAEEGEVAKRRWPVMWEHAGGRVWCKGAGAGRQRRWGWGWDNGASPGH